MSTRFPTRGLLPRGAAHLPARSLPRLQGAHSAASSPTPAARRPRLHPSPGDLCVSGGLSASSPPVAPRGQQPPRKPRSAANSSGGYGSPPPPRGPPQPARHSRSPRRARTGDRRDPHPSRLLTGVTIPARPRRQLTSKCGDRGLRAGAQSERMQVRWRRTRRGASSSGLPPPLAPSAPRGLPAASRVAEPPAQHGSRAAEPRGRPSTPSRGAGAEQGGRSRAAGPPGAGET